jgi:hypothetical protein
VVEFPPFAVDSFFVILTFAGANSSNFVAFASSFIVDASLLTSLLRIQYERTHTTTTNTRTKKATRDQMEGETMSEETGSKTQREVVVACS